MENTQKTKKIKKTILPFHIVLLGQNASGKDTQAEILVSKYKLKTVESGKYTRMMLKSKTLVGDAFRKSAGKGWAAPMKYMKVFFTEVLEKKSKNTMLLFLGGPRLKPEAQLLEKLLRERKEPYVVLYMSLPDKEVYRRSLFRSQSNVKDIFKVFDTDKKIISNRIKYHKEQVYKTVDYFKTHAPFAQINGNQPISKVTVDIHRALLAFLKKM